MVCCSILEVVVEGVIDGNIIKNRMFRHVGWLGPVGRKRCIGGILPWQGNIEIEGVETAGRDESEELAVRFNELEGMILE